MRCSAKQRLSTDQKVASRCRLDPRANGCRRLGVDVAVVAGPAAVHRDWHRGRFPVLALESAQLAA